MGGRTCAAFKHVQAKLLDVQGSKYSQLVCLALRTLLSPVPARIVATYMQLKTDPMEAMLSQLQDSPYLAIAK